MLVNPSAKQTRLLEGHKDTQDAPNVFFHGSYFSPKSLGGGMDFFKFPMSSIKSVKGLSEPREQVFSFSLSF